MSADMTKYTSSNGYTGVLYGESSYSIYDSNGNEVMHTGSRNINTYEELVNCVEEYPRLRQLLLDKFDDLFQDDEDVDI